MQFEDKILKIGYIKTWRLRITTSSRKVISVHGKRQMKTGEWHVVKHWKSFRHVTILSKHIFSQK